MRPPATHMCAETVPLLMRHAKSVRRRLSLVMPFYAQMAYDGRRMPTRIRFGERVPFYEVYARTFAPRCL